MAGGSSTCGRRGGRGGRGRWSPRQTKGKDKDKVVPEGVKANAIDKGEKGRSVPTFWFGGEKLPEHYKFRPSACNRVKVHIWHGGKFVWEPVLDYINGACKVLDDWDVEYINSIDMCNLIKKFGYVSFNLWYRHPGLGLAKGCKPFRHDRDVLSFLEDVKGYSVIDFYVEHIVESYPFIVHSLEGPQGNGDVVKEGPQGNGERVNSEGTFEVEGTVEVEGINESGDGINEGGIVHGDGINEETHDGDSEESSDDSDYDEHEGSDSEVSLDDSDYDEKWQWSKLFENYGEDGEHETEDEDEDADLNARGLTCFEEIVFEDDSSALETPPGSDEEDVMPREKYPTFKLGAEGSEVKFALKQKFDTSKLFKTALKEYALHKKKNVIVEKSDSKRVVIKCEGECPFYCRLAKYEQNNFWQIVSLVDEHSCCRSSKNRHAKTQLLAKKLMPTITHNPKMKCKSVVAECQIRWGVALNRFQASRIRAATKRMIDGAEKEQYKHLRSYADEILRTNPNSTVKIKCEMGADGPVFQRIYMCYAACKMAFAHHCRPLIGLDECFLKGVYGGQLLTAVGKDGNNQMFPIAFAVVEAETRDSWEWFIDLLLSDLNTLKPHL